MSPGLEEQTASKIKIPTQIFDELVAKKAVIRCIKETSTPIPEEIRSSPEKIWRSGNDVVNWLNEGKEHTIGISLASLGLVCVAVRSPKLAQKLIALFRHSTDCLVTTTPRGGCHLYFRSMTDKMYATEARDSIKSVVCCGAQVELPTRFVTFLGAGYDIVNDLQLGPELPFEAFRFLPKIFAPVKAKGEEWSRIEPIVSRENNYSIVKGTRLHTLSHWGTILRKHGIEGTDFTLIMNTINHTFCRPPLPEDEVNVLLTSLEKRNVVLSRPGKDLSVAPEAGLGAPKEKGTPPGDPGSSLKGAPELALPADYLEKHPAQKVTESIEQGLKRWYLFDPLNLGEALGQYQPFSRYSSWKTVDAAYQSCLIMPVCWQELGHVVELLQPPPVRDNIYKNLARKDPRPKS